ncbi:MAG: hypothetical protein JW774_11040 [Candidatus Aureabacteria bacterium]|nr:hypothetical protein [Candidatus Auribacterota bacterium]
MTSNHPGVSIEENNMHCRKCNDDLLQQDRPEIKKDHILIHYKCISCHAKYCRKISKDSDIISQV